MPNITQAHYLKMKNSYRLDVAKHLAALAIRGETMTYGALADKFGGTARGWGDALGGIAIRCHEAELPILSVLVVNSSTGLPSTDAVLYEDLGLGDEIKIKSEMQRCFAFDWNTTPLKAASA